MVHNVQVLWRNPQTDGICARCARVVKTHQHFVARLQTFAQSRCFAGFVPEKVNVKVVGRHSFACFLGDFLSLNSAVQFPEGFDGSQPRCDVIVGDVLLGCARDCVVVLKDAERGLHSEDSVLYFFGAAADGVGSIADFEFAEMLPGTLGKSAEISDEPFQSSSRGKVPCPHGVFVIGIGEKVIIFDGIAFLFLMNGFDVFCGR